MAKLSIVIPSKNERFLWNTITDILEHATGDIELFVVADGYSLRKEEYVDDPRVSYLTLPPTSAAKKRHAINMVSTICTGEYLMSLDAHCMMAYGFDETLIAHHEEGAISIPRRHRLDAEHWCLQLQSDGRPPIDYEYFMYPGKFGDKGLHGFRWDARTLSRKDIMVDDNLTFQGSCWMMHTSLFQRLGFMQIEGYTGWGQEAEELGLTVRLHGGRVLTNKYTWYAHLHKGKTYGRMYFLRKSDLTACYNFSYDLWVRKNKQFFVDLIEKFMPVPGWPEDSSQWKL